MIEPRWFDDEDAARYLGLKLDAFRRGVDRGIFPKPSRHIGPRTPRWDRHALDSAMSGGTVTTDTRTAFDALAEKIQTEGRPRRSAQAS